MNQRILPISHEKFMQIASNEEIQMYIAVNNLYAMAKGFPKYSAKFNKKAGKVKNRLIKSIRNKVSVCS